MTKKTSLSFSRKIYNYMVAQAAADAARTGGHPNVSGFVSRLVARHMAAKAAKAARNQPV